jgi:hypothetical protein
MAGKVKIHPDTLSVSLVLTDKEREYSSDLWDDERLEQLILDGFLIEVVDDKKKK